MPADFPVIVLTETWFDDEHEWDELPRYAAYHSIRGIEGAGV